MRFKIKSLVIMIVIAISMLAACTKQKIGSEGTLSMNNAGVKAQSGAVVNPDSLGNGLQNPYVYYYSGEGDGGLAHVTYWTISGAALSALPAAEQAKVAKIKANQLHSLMYAPSQIVAGYEVTGTLTVEDRTQIVTLRIPDNWNKKIVVGGTPGNRNEYANEAILAPWILAQGYAFITSDKGTPAWANLVNGTHITSKWGMMMIDMAKTAQANIEAATNKKANHTYAAGLSNGGYQVRRALEIDEELVVAGNRRLFDGGLDWAGTYFPGVADMDTNSDGTVSVAEFAVANHLVTSLEKAALTMKWCYDPATLTTPANYATAPRYAEAFAGMTDGGWNAESDIFWGYYNMYFDYYKNYGAAYMAWKGVGYYNFTAWAYRADLKGDTYATSMAYSPFYNTVTGAEPAFYNYVRTATNGNWTDADVIWALKNANTGNVGVKMITVQGDKDGLLAIDAHGTAYANAIARSGKQGKYRFYVIANAPHVDRDADGYGDFNFDGVSSNENAKNELTPLQKYAEKAFDMLTDWVENKVEPVASKTVATDPANDVTDKSQINF